MATILTHKAAGRWQERPARHSIVLLVLTRKTARRRLGPANVTLTRQVYARVTAEADRRAAELVGEQFRPRDTRGMDRRVR